MNEWNPPRKNRYVLCMRSVCVSPICMFEIKSVKISVLVIIIVLNFAVLTYWAQAQYWELKLSPGSSSSVPRAQALCREHKNCLSSIWIHWSQKNKINDSTKNMWIVDGFTRLLAWWNHDTRSTSDGNSTLCRIWRYVPVTCAVSTCSYVYSLTQLPTIQYVDYKYSSTDDC